MYDEVIDGSVQSIRAVYDYALQILTYEITARCFFYIERCVVRGGGDVQTDDVIQERELQQRADGDYGADEGHEGLLRHRHQDREGVVL